MLLIDDDPLVCQSLQTILSADPAIQVVGMAYDGQRAIDLFRESRPDVLLIDIRMEKMSGLTAAEQILREFHTAKILFLTTFSDDEYIIKALRMGAKGYLLKQDFESIIPALKAVFAGQNVFGDTIVTKMPELLKDPERPPFTGLGINAREEEIVALVAEGLNNKEIAKKLFLSEGTVRNYISTILEKLRLRDRTQLAIFYLKQRG